MSGTDLDPEAWAIAHELIALFALGNIEGLEAAGIIDGPFDPVTRHCAHIAAMNACVLAAVTDQPLDEVLRVAMRSDPLGPGLPRQHISRGGEPMTPTKVSAPPTVPDGTAVVKTGHPRRCPTCSAPALHPCTTATGIPMSLVHALRRRR